MQSTSHTTTDTFTVVPRDALIETSNLLFARADLMIKEHEDLFTIDVAEMTWDIGVKVYEPADPTRIPRGADCKLVGVFLLHGGAGDFKTMESRARFLVSKFGYRVVSGTFPGRLYLADESRDWPGDTIADDGTVRTPIWSLGEEITPDQYDVQVDQSMLDRYGRRTVAKAKSGTIFRDRLAASPLAMEAACRTAIQRHFPESEFSVYLHGHSTGGPLQFSNSQRTANIQGVLAIENSAFGYINAAKHAWAGLQQRVDPFDELAIRTWRDLARYAGPEALGQQGPDALRRLPSLMESILDAWETQRKRPQFKCEYLVTWNIIPSLIAAAEHTAARLKYNESETAELIGRYVGLTRELPAETHRPVPNVLFGISLNSPDHPPAVYEEAILPLFAAMKPAPLVTVTHFQAGAHGYADAEENLPLGIAPAVFASWDEAIRNGYFVKD